jgi:hypothetical protein
MPPIRNLTTPNDNGPAAVLRPRLSRTGNGARLIVKSNPFSFTVDSLTPCIPFLSLMGNRTPQSAAARQALLNGQDPTSLLDPATGQPVKAQPGATGTTPSPAATAPNVPAPGPGAGSIPNPVGGPFGYIGVSQTGHY